MTDQELIALLKEKGPEGLTEGDLALLKQRLPDSPKLRDELANYVQLEELLVASLKPVTIVPDDITRRAGREAQPRRGESGAAWITLAVAGSGLLALFLIAVAIFAALWRPHGPLVADKKPDPPAQGPEKQPQSGDPKMPPDGMPPTAPMPGDPKPPLPMPVDPKPMPAPKPPDPPPPPVLAPVAIVRDATQHGQASVTRGSERWGLVDVAFVTSEQPAFAEYEFDLPREGTYELRLRYAAETARPLTLSINGKKHGAQLALRPPLGLAPAQAPWTNEGEFALRAGKNVLRLESAAAFPQLLQLALSSSDAIAQVDPTDPRGVKVDKQPWAAAFEQPGPLPPWSEVAFKSFEFDKKIPSRDEVKVWFSTVPGRQSQIVQRNIGNTPCGGFEGVVRLNAPWTSDSVLRLALTETREMLQFHFFDGTQGATAAWHRNYYGIDDMWFGYSTIRDGGNPLPKTMTLTASDDGRGRRTEQRFGGPLEFRYRAGEVLVSRGDVVILRVPLAGPPREVYVEGAALIRGIALARCVGDPPRETTWEGAARSVTPASLDWKTELRGNGAKFEKREDGSVLFETNKPNGLCWMAANFPAGYHAVEFQVDEIPLGAGFFLGNEKAFEQTDILHIGADDRSQPSLMWTNVFNVHRGGQAAPRRISGPAWFRLLWGPDTYLAWVSSDGRHWASMPSLRRDLRNVTRFGISFPQQVNPGTKVVLRNVRFRDVQPFDQLAKPELVERVPIAEHDLEVLSLGKWQKLVADSKPEDVDYTAWKRAWLVASLGRGINRFTAFGLMDELVAEMGERGDPIPLRLAALRAAMLIGDAPDNAERVRRVAERFHQVGEEAYRNGEMRPFTLIRHSLMTATALSPANYRVVHEPLVRWELLNLLAAKKPAEVQQLCRELRFFEQHGFCRLTGWAEFAAAGQANIAGVPPVESRPDWRNPLIEELSKETYNVLAEFQAVLESNSPQDAARMITQADPQIAIGLAPSGQDKQLFVSVPVAFEAAIRQDPRLAAAMKQDYGPLAELRVRQAMAEGNPLAVQLITVRYHGTEAAAEAYRWLGDRALSGGQFSLAMSYYERAKATGSAGLRGQINLRARLAAAMLGLDYGDKITTPVQFGEVRMSADEYETMVAEAKKNRGTEPRATPGLAPPAPPAGLYKLERRSRFEGERGQNPQNIEHRHVRALLIPWADRQIAAAIDGDTAFISNRFHVSAYDLTNGNRRWQSPPPPGQVGKAHDWTLTPMRPVAAGSRIVCRQLLATGPMLCAYDRANGSLAWSQPPTAGEHVASDPILLHDTLYAVTVKRQEQGEYYFRLSTYDLNSGQLMSHQPLVRLKDNWIERKVCQLSALDDGFAVSLGGVVLACDLAGQVRWIRRELLLPPDEEPDWVRQYHEPPLVSGGKLIVLQPSQRNVLALDPGTGTVQWQTPLADVQRTVGINDGRLIVQTSAGLTALNLADGKVAWTRPLEGLMDGQLCGATGDILVSQAVVAPVPPGQPKRLTPQLVWVRPADGSVAARSPLADLTDPVPQLGGFLAREGKFFALTGRTLEDPTRDLIELVRTGDAPPAPAEPKGRFLPLNVAVDDTLQLAGNHAFPGWQVIASTLGERTGQVAEVDGQRDVLGLRLTHNGVVGFRSYVAMPAKNPRIKLLIHIPADHQLKLVIYFEGVKLHERAFDKESGWQDLTIDAPSAAGKSGEVLVLLTKEGPQPAGTQPVFWKRLEISQ